MIGCVHSLLVHVPDLDAAAADYAQLFGRSALRFESDPDSGRRSGFFRLANVSLELREPGADARSGEPAGMGQAGLRLALESQGEALDEERRIRAALAARSLRFAWMEREIAMGEKGSAPRGYERIRLAPEDTRGLPIELIHRESPPLEEAAQPRPDHADETVVGLDHLVVLSPAPDDSLRLFRDALGLRLALDRSFEQRGVRLIFFRVGGTTIEIGSRLGPPPQPERGDAFGGLAWRVPNVDAIRARLLGSGFDVSEVRAGHTPGTRVCTVRRPTHGVPTLLIQPADPN